MIIVPSNVLLEKIIFLNDSHLYLNGLHDVSLLWLLVTTVAKEDCCGPDPKPRKNLQLCWFKVSIENSYLPVTYLFG